MQESSTPSSFDERFGADKTGKKSMTAFIKSPLALTAVVLLGGAAFAGVMMTAYSSGDDAAVPIVTADAGPYKVKPNEEGGMDVPFADSTVFDSMKDAEVDTHVENLLASSDDVEDEGSAAISNMDVSDEIIDISENLHEQAEKGIAISSAAPVAPVVSEEEGAENLLAKVKPSEEEMAAVAEEATPAPTPAVVAEKNAEPAPVAAKVAETSEDAAKKIRPAGSSPETLAFVRSVLDQKDGKPSAVDAEKVNGIEPAAGMASMAAGTDGTHFVQLASVTNAAAAASEWPKIQAKYSALSGAAFRVQTADLGARGTFYRIQAGPFSESKAKSVCDAIKAQTPGGCLVVKK